METKLFMEPELDKFVQEKFAKLQETEIDYIFQFPESAMLLKTIFTAEFYAREAEAAHKELDTLRGLM